MAKIDITTAHDLTEDRTSTGLNDWMASAEPGEVVIYHVGKHCGGSHRGAVADAVDAGLLLAVQIRVEAGIFAYVAMRTAGRRK